MKDQQKGRDGLIKLAKEGTDAEVSAAISALHLGATVKDMIDGVCEAFKKRGDLVEDHDDRTFGAATIMCHKPSGDNYAIQVHRVGPREIKEFEGAMERAEEL